MADVVNFNLRSLEFNPVIDNGSDTRFILGLRNRGNEEIDLTGSTAVMELRPYRVPDPPKVQDTTFLLELRDPTNGEFNLSGYTAKMEIRPYPKSATIYDTLTTENNRLIISGSNIEISFPAKVTAKYKFSEACYDLLLLIGDHQWRIAEGLISFHKGVTNGW